MRVLIAGASGFLGTALATRLEAAGFSVVRLRRGARSDGASAWNPAEGYLAADALDGVRAVVNLAGESIAGGWWTAARRRRIRESRVQGTALLARAVAQRRGTVEVFINASAVGIYGDRGDVELTEQSDTGEGFLADVGVAWEGATVPAAEAGVRVVLPRFGILLHPSGGVLHQLLPPFRLGLGAQLGNGQQWMSWLALDDAVTILCRMLGDATLAGPVNAVTPHPVRNREFTQAIGAAIRRPTLFRAPAFALKLVMGDLARELLLASQRCVPARLVADSHPFAYPTLPHALAAMFPRADASPPR